MKLYKYISLDTIEKIGWFESIILNQEIWFSKFKYLNDPMEGIYTTFSNHDKIDEIALDKSQFVIGCFAKNPENFTLWAYYADGFSGACIEIKASSDFQPYTIEYLSNEKFNKPLDGNNLSVEAILSRKLNKWRNEGEIRILKKEICGDERGKLIKVGDIDRIIIGIRISDCVIKSLEKLAENNSINKKISWAIAYPNKNKMEIHNTLNCVLRKTKEYNDWRRSFEKVGNKIYNNKLMK